MRDFDYDDPTISSMTSFGVLYREIAVSVIEKCNWGEWRDIAFITANPG